MSFLLPEIENTDVQTTLNGKASGELARTITAYTQGREALRQWTLFRQYGRTDSEHQGMAASPFTNSRWCCATIRIWTASAG
jgi:hypothetical protein